MRLSEAQIAALRKCLPGQEIEKIEDIQKGLGEEGHLFSLDTNVLVNLARDKEGYAILRALAVCKNLVLSGKTIREIDGLIIGKVLGSRTTCLENFIKSYKRRTPLKDSRDVGKIAQRIMAALRPYILLLPRKLVIDVMITSPDSFYHTISADLNDDILFENEKMKITGKIVAKFDELAREYGIYGLITDSQKSDYFRDAEKVRNEILDIIKNFRRASSMLKSALLSYAGKDFSNDVAIVSDALANGVEALSKDPDVKWLNVFGKIKKFA